MASKEQAERDQYGRATGKRGADNKKEEVTDVSQWLKTSVQRLIQHNHHLLDIKEYALDQVVAFLEEIERVDAGSRIAFVSDMSVVVSGVMGGSKGITDHLNSLEKVIKGE